VLQLVVALGLVAALVQPTTEVRRAYDPRNAEFRDELNQSLIVIDLDPTGSDFGKFGLFVYPSTFEPATGYFGVSTPRTMPDGAFSVDEHVAVVIQRPTGEITPDGRDVPMLTDSGTIQLQGVLDLTRHVGSLRLIVDGRDVTLEASEPNLAGAAETASAAITAYVGEDWPTLYELYTEGLRLQVTRAEFEEQMRAMTPPGPPVQVLSSEVAEAQVGTRTGFVHYSQVSRADLLQPSGRVTPANVFVDVIWEGGRWRLFHINIQRQSPAPGQAAPAA
jgi:hypothetical protein